MKKCVLVFLVVLMFSCALKAGLSNLEREPKEEKLITKKIFLDFYTGKKVSVKYTGSSYNFYIGNEKIHSTENHINFLSENGKYLAWEENQGKKHNVKILDLKTKKLIFDKAIKNSERGIIPASLKMDGDYAVWIELHYKSEKAGIFLYDLNNPVLF